MIKPLCSPALFVKKKTSAKFIHIINPWEGGYGTVVVLLNALGRQGVMNRTHLSPVAHGVCNPSQGLMGSIAERNEHLSPTEGKNSSVVNDMMRKIVLLENQRNVEAQLKEALEYNWGVFTHPIAVKYNRLS